MKITQTTTLPPKEFYDMAMPLVQVIHRRSHQPAFASDISLIGKALYAAFEAGMMQGNCGECGAHD